MCILFVWNDSMAIPIVFAHTEKNYFVQYTNSFIRLYISNIYSLFYVTKQFRKLYEFDSYFNRILRASFESFVDVS